MNKKMCKDIIKVLRKLELAELKKRVKILS